MRTWLGAFVCSLATVAAVACTPAEDAGTESEGAMDEAADVPQSVSSEMLSDWSVRLDESGGDMSAFWMETEEGGFSVETGPAGIAWRAVDLVQQGDYTASATFTERAAPEGHREAYGIVVGGKHLDSPDQEYTYFLVRGDGNYLVKRRTGESTSTLVDWSPSDAISGIQAAGAGQDNPNELAVRVRGEQVEFVANGTVVETLPADQVEPWGLAGIRVNHNLDVRVDEWTVEGATGQAAEGDGGETGRP